MFTVLGRLSMHHLTGRSRGESGELKSVFSAAEFDGVAKIEMQWLGKRARVDTQSRTLRSHIHSAGAYF